MTEPIDVKLYEAGRLLRASGVHVIRVEGTDEVLAVQVQIFLQEFLPRKRVTLCCAEPLVDAIVQCCPRTLEVEPLSQMHVGLIIRDV